MNKWLGTGRLTRDPESRSTSTGMTIATFGVAVQGLKKDEVDFIDCKAFGQTADFVMNYFKKGKPAELEGRLKLETWESDGQKRSKVVVYLDRVNFVNDGGNSKPAAQSSDDEDDINIHGDPALLNDDDDVPF